MRPASTVVFPLPGPASTLSGPSPAVTTSRWLREKSLRSTPGSQGRQFLRSAAVACQLVPSQQIPAVDEVQKFVRGASAGDAGDEFVLVIPIVVSLEQIEGFSCVAQNRQNGLDGDVSKNVIGWHSSRDSCRRVAPHVEVELLKPSET